MIEIREGISNKPASAKKLLTFFKEKQDSFNGVIYIGYPILYTAGESLIIDALWISPEYGIIVFHLIDGHVESSQSEIIDIQNELYSKVESMFIGYSKLKNRRTFLGIIDVITFAPLISSESLENKIISSEENLNKCINSFLNTWNDYTETLYTTKLSIVQSMIHLKPTTKRNITRFDSKGANLKTLENAMATLDADQEKAVIESFDGIQRIRGLAGSGKTVVLALKAAYLHALNPQWNIAITFNSRSLKKQFIDLLNIFSIQRTGQPFDENKVHIIHAWGSSRQGNGVYYNFCISHGITFLNVDDAKKIKFASKEHEKPLIEFVCRKAINEVNTEKTLYNAILVDEAQDLSVSFLKLCYKALDNNKRLIYAYDELQKLDEGSSLPKPIDIFGRDADKDTILHVCYRNSRPVLATAHALGFGIYRDENKLINKEPKLVQFFDEPKLWAELGYESLGEELTHGNNIILSRTKKSSPEILENYAVDVIDFKTFNNHIEQAEWVSNQIINDLNNEDLLHKDILVINPVSYATDKSISELRKNLLDHGINSHIAGAFNPDVFYEDNSITISGIRRAKGNEVPMVYIINAHDCFSGYSLMKLRNILFTAITRSKAWVRVLGIGNKMDDLTDEFYKVKNNSYKLEFKYPTPDEIKKMNIIHREKSENEIDKINEDMNLFDKMYEFAQRISSGDANLEDYDEKYHPMLKKLLNLNE